MQRQVRIEITLGRMPASNLANDTRKYGAQNPTGFFAL